MGFFSSRKPARSGLCIGTHDVIAGVLQLTVVSHEIRYHGNSIPCWSYISRGLRARGQQEVVLTLRRHPDENKSQAPQDGIQLVRALDASALHGKYANEGDITVFGSQGPFGAEAVLYCPGRSLDGVIQPRGALAALLLTKEEAVVAKRFGATRVLTRLGLATGYYPHPPWSERGRASVAQANEPSILLAGVGLTRYPGTVVAQHGHDVIARLPQTAVSSLAAYLDQVRSRAPIALMASIHDDAEAHLVWTPGQSEAKAIGPQIDPHAPIDADSLLRVAGSYLAFLPGKSANRGCQSEDGFVFELTDDAWTEIRTHLGAGKTYTLAAPISDPTSLSLSLTWY